MTILCIAPYFVKFYSFNAHGAYRARKVSYAGYEAPYDKANQESRHIMSPLSYVVKCLTITYGFVKVKKISGKINDYIS